MDPKLPILLASLTAILATGALRPIHAQTHAPAEPAARTDAAATIGWLAVEQPNPGQYGGWRWGHTALGALSAGLYSTDHLKTEIEAAMTGRIRHYGGRPEAIEGMTVYVPVRSTSDRRSLALSQHYQFYRNAWFHPHAAGGVDVRWERSTEVIGPVVIFDSRSPGRQVREQVTIGPRTEVTVRPFVAIGSKGYFTQRGFVRADLRLVFHAGIDEVLTRFGFGIDF